MDSAHIYARDIAFDPLNYEFDAETMIEPFTYFQYDETPSFFL